MSEKDLSIAAETADEFWKAYQEAIQEFRKGFVQNDSLKVGNEGEKQTTIQRAKQQLDQLQQYVTVSTIALPPYDRKRSQEMLETLKKDWKEVETILVPKKKFAFSNRSKVTSSSSSSATSTINLTNALAQPAPTTNTNSISLLPPGSFVISDQSGEMISLRHPPITDAITTTFFFTTTPTTLKTDETNKSDNKSDLLPQLYIKNNKGCTISLPWLSGSVRIENCEDCEIFLGPCMTSVYLEGATRCGIFACGHQLRIHNCHSSQLYVRVQSHPIIEDCSEMKFAPYSLSYDSIEADIVRAELQQASCWDNVVDFRWLKSIKSPNWDVLPESERRPPIVF